MTAKEELKGKLQGKMDSINNKDKDNKNLPLSDTLRQMESQFKMVLPKFIDPERFLRVALTEVRINPKLNDCNRSTVLGAFMTAASLGLQPGLLGQCYLIPFYSKKRDAMECQFIIGYQGMIDLARRGGSIQSIYSQIVKQNDTFEYEYGLEPKLVHKPAMKDRGSSIGAYVVAKFKDGGYYFEFMNIEDIEKRRRRSKTSESGPWVTDYDEMCMKTVIRHSFKYLPISVEHLAVLSVDENTTKINENLKWDDNNDYFDLNEIVEINKPDYIDVEINDTKS